MTQEQKRVYTISDYLGTGKENAKSAQKIAVYFETSTRDITRRIEMERREGAPICATCGNPAGYFLAANETELETFCSQLKGRAIEIFKTRKALLQQLPTIKGADNEQSGNR